MGAGYDCFSKKLPKNEFAPIMPISKNWCRKLDPNKIKSFSRRLSQRPFVRNVAVVASGTAGAQAITMAFSPVITRLYGPEVFGLLGIFMALVAMIAPIAALSYPIAIVLPKVDGDAEGIARLSLYISLGISVMLAMSLLVAGDWLVELLGVQDISSFIMLIPLVIIIAAWLEINQQWLIRKKQFKISAKIAVIHAFIINSSKAGIGFFKPVTAVLIVLYVFGIAIHALMLSFWANKPGERNNNAVTHHPIVSLRDLAKRHYDFPLYRAPQLFINAISQNIPILMLTTFFGPVSAGLYVLCKSVLGVPSQLISKSVGDVFYPKIVEVNHGGGNLTKIIVRATFGLGIISIAPFALVVAFGPWLFGFVFGAEWVVAGEYGRWLALWMFSAVISRPSVVSIPVLSLQGLFLIFEILSISIRFAALLVGFYVFKSDILAILLFSLAGTFLNLSLIFATCNRAKFVTKAGNITA